MNNVASFPHAKELATKLLEVFANLAGNSKSFDPMIEGIHEVVVTKAVERLSAKGKEMKEINFRSLKDGRDATLYVMKFRKHDWKKWEHIEVGANLVINYKLNNGFANVEIISEKGFTEIVPKPNVALTKQTILLYDIEIFKKDELFVFRDYFTKEWIVINNDLNALRKFYLEYRDSLFIGYNNASYDDNVMRATLQGKKSYHISKTIISNDDRAAQYKMYDMKKTPLFSMDLYQDNRGYSLKEHSAFLGINIKETQVDFDMDRELTEEEKILNELYCKNDVLATELRFEQNIGMLLAKATIALMFDLDKKAMGLTNANLTAEVLGAKRQAVRDDLVDPYELDSKLNVETPEIREAYLNHEFELNDKGKLNVALDYVDPETGYEMTYGSGGIHGAVPSFIRIGRFLARDFGSLYPNTMINFNLLSRNIPEHVLSRYADLLTQRMNAKYNKEKTVTIKGVELPTNIMVNGLKLPLNTKFGASGAEFNALYDPRNQFLVCVTGQLIMTEFYEIIKPYCTMIQSNTDCHMYVPNSEVDEIEMDKKLEEFYNRIGITLDKDEFVEIWQKDVNNYIGVDASGSVKIKGAIGLTGGLKNSKAIVSNAFINYLVAGKDYKEFVNECDELRQFQIITKTGWTFDETIVRDAEGNEEPAQKVNRVFAVKDASKAVELFKVKKASYSSEDEIEVDYPNGDILYSPNPDEKELAEYHKQVKKAEERKAELVAMYHANKDANGVWSTYNYTKGLANAPEAYAISNEMVGEGITLDEVDKEYYIDQVEDTLELWFGSEWKERVEQAHSERRTLGIATVAVKNYID